MSDVKTETIPAATETGAHDANDAMTEMIPAATETGAQDTNDAMTETIPSVNETDALAESAEIIWTGPHPAIAESAEIIWSHATMVELAQATADSRPAAETGPASETVHAAGRAGGRHAAPRPAGTRPTAAGLAKRGEGRHAAARPAGSVARRLAISAGSAAMVAVGLHAVAS